MTYISNPPVNFVKLMVFIDGAYLRKHMQNELKTDSIDFYKLRTILPNLPYITNESLQLIRAYYYDAIIDRSKDTEEEWKKQNAYFENIRNEDFYEVRLGRLIIQGDGTYKQKGVDILLAIDMITKAYEGHYDVCILLAGDDDMVDLVKAVKDAGKRVYGAFFDKEISKRLKDSFDKRIILDKYCQSFIKG